MIQTLEKKIYAVSVVKWESQLVIAELSRIGSADQANRNQNTMKNRDVAYKNRTTDRKNAVRKR